MHFVMAEVGEQETKAERTERRSLEIKALLADPTLCAWQRLQRAFPDRMPTWSIGPRQSITIVEPSDEGHVTVEALARELRMHALRLMRGKSASRTAWQTVRFRAAHGRYWATLRFWHLHEPPTDLRAVN